MVAFWVIGGWLLCSLLFMILAIHDARKHLSVTVEGFLLLSLAAVSMGPIILVFFLIGMFTERWGKKVLFEQKNDAAR